MRSIKDAIDDAADPDADPVKEVLSDAVLPAIAVAGTAPASAGWAAMGGVAPPPAPAASIF
jgi:hypothetical protein